MGVRASVALLFSLLVTGCGTVGPAMDGSGGPGPDAASICGGLAQAGRWPDYDGGEEALLAPFLACASPAEFVELQRGVDMPRLVAALDDWSAVRLGAMGPLLGGTDLLTRKRAAFLVEAEQEYGGRRASRPCSLRGEGGRAPGQSLHGEGRS